MLRRGLNLILALLVVSLLSATLAHASSIVYLDGNDDVWLTTADGARKRQLTTNGSTLRYASPSATDAGVIVAPATRATFYYFNLDGSSAGGPWAALDMNCSSMQSAVSNQVAPNGAMNVYWYMNNGSACLSAPSPTVAFATFNGLTAAGVNPKFGGAWYPRWVPGTNYAAAVKVSGEVISTLDRPGGSPWLTDAEKKLRYFDISRSGGNVLLALASSPDVSSPSDLVLWHQDSTPPAGGGAAVCALPGWGTNNQAPDISIPKWSPDGTQFTWSTSAGVFVSPAPVPDGSQRCVISPTLIAPGGHAPDWGAPDVPGQPGTGQPGTGTPGTGTPGTGTPTQGSTLTKAKVKKVTSSGRIDLSVTAPGPGRIAAVATVLRSALRGATTASREFVILDGVHAALAPRRATYGTAAKKVTKAGVVTLKISPTNPAKRALRNGRRLKVRIAVTFTPRTGRASTKTLNVTVRGRRR